MAVTNTFEGTAFVDASASSTVQVPNYVAQLFPRFSQKEIDAAAAQYAGLGTPYQQVVGIQGEGQFFFKGCSHSKAHSKDSNLYLPDVFCHECFWREHLQSKVISVVVVPYPIGFTGRICYCTRRSRPRCILLLHIVSRCEIQYWPL
jgi:hypothetical protein